MQRGTASRYVVGECFLLLLSPKTYTMRSDFRRRLPTVAFHLFISSRREQSCRQITNLCRSVISAFTWLSKPPPSVRLQCVRFATVSIPVIARLLSGLVVFQWHSIAQSR